VDNLSRTERSKQMSLVRSKNTKPEILVRELVLNLGYRCQLHRTDLPGCPDMVFPRLKRIIFVHGCFWHAHGCRLARMPKSRRAYWKNKIERNGSRDLRTLRRLRGMRWRCLVIWECQLSNPEAVSTKIKMFLRSSGALNGKVRREGP
jgi:DNA mismatch endonuclease, patch repair protein